MTGVVLRTFAVHPHYQQSEAAKQATSLLASRFFMPDAYADRRAVSYWESVSFLFWFTDIVSALDSLSLLGLERENPHIATALEWLKARQQWDGLFELKLLRDRDKDLRFWVCLAICRIFRRLHEMIV